MYLTGFKRKVSWEGPVEETQVVVEVKEQPRQPDRTPKPNQTQLRQAGPARAARNGNGHKTLKSRELTNFERDCIQLRFRNLNGCLSASDKLCTVLCNDLNNRGNNRGPSDITVFQVTGFVSVLHRRVAEGNLKFKDEAGMLVYKGWMKSRYNLWAQYNSEKYQKYRNKKLEIEGSKIHPRRYVYGM